MEKIWNTIKLNMISKGIDTTLRNGTVWRNMPQSILSIKLMQLGCTYIATNNDLLSSSYTNAYCFSMKSQILSRAWHHYASLVFRILVFPKYVLLTLNKKAKRIRSIYLIVFIYVAFFFPCYFLFAYSNTINTPHMSYASKYGNIVL